MSEPIYCGLAFGSVSIGNQGELRPCCGIISERFPINISDRNLDINLRINSERMKRVRRDLMNGVWHPACHTCKNTEDLGLESMRIIWNRTIDSAPMTEHMDPSSVKFLDLSLGNKCNSKCMTCSPGSSDFWIEEYEYITKNPQRYIPSSYINNDKISEFTDKFTNVEFISLIGGEPIIIDEHRELLKTYIDKGLSEKINLSYVTNLTGMDEELIELWNKFKSVGASISIDGYGKVNDYIRYPIKFNKVESNLRKYLELIAQQKFGMTLSCTISLFNINEYADTLDFYISLIEDMRKEKELSSNRLAIYLNRVTSPEYFNSALLSTEYRANGLEKIQKLKEKIKDLDMHHSVIESCKLIESWMVEPQIINPKLINEAINFITKSDEFRKRNIDDYIPGLLNELKSYV